MSFFVQSHLPNRKVVHDRVANTSWHLVDIVGDASSTTPFPNLDPGAFAGALSIRSEDGSGGDGAAFYYAVNCNLPTNDNEGSLCSGSGQTLSLPGHIRKLYVRKTTAANEIIAEVRW